MAATSVSAVRDLLAAAAGGVRWFQDGAPAGWPENTAGYPFGVVQYAGWGGSEPLGDHGDPGRDLDVVDLVQVDLYQVYAAPAGPGRVRVVEDPALVDAVYTAVHRAAPGLVAGQPAASCVVVGTQPWPLADNVRRHTWTVALRRTIRAVG